MKIEELYSEIVKQLEERADVETASKRIAKAKYFGITIKSYGLREAQWKATISKNACMEFQESKRSWKIRCCYQ